MGRFPKLSMNFKLGLGAVGVLLTMTVAHLVVRPLHRMQRLSYHGAEAEKLMALQRKRLAEEAEPSPSHTPSKDS